MTRRLLRNIKNRFETFRHRRFVQKSVQSGLVLGQNVTIMKDVRFDPPHQALISIGDNTTICPGVHFIAHDASIFKQVSHSRMGCIRISADCFIGEKAIILPGVSIGPRTIVGAGAVVARDVPEGSVAAGNPARVIGSFDAYLEKQKEAIQSAQVYEYSEFYADIAGCLKRIPDETSRKRFYTRNQIKQLRRSYRFNTTE